MVLVFVFVLIAFAIFAIVPSHLQFIDSNGAVYPCNLLVDEKFQLGNITENSFDDIWLNASIKNELACLSVDVFSECKSCEIRYFCGGGCRGIAYNANGDIRSTPPNCHEKKESIFSYLWEFAQDDNLYNILKGAAIYE